MTRTLTIWRSSLAHKGCKVSELRAQVAELQLDKYGYFNGKVTYDVLTQSNPKKAAAGLVNNIFGLVFVSYMGFTYGLTPIIGRLYCEERTYCIGQKVRNAFCANMLTGVIFTLALIVLYLNLGRIGQPEELLSLIRP